METVEVLVRIPKDLYEGIECRNGELETEYVCDELMKAVDNGTVLTKGHEYIDRNNAITSICQYYATCERMKMFYFTPNLIKQEVVNILIEEPTIIEADKDGE